jgi:hypothetical protein
MACEPLYPEVPARGAALFAYKDLAPSQWREIVKTSLMTYRSVPLAARNLDVATGTLRTWIKETPDLGKRGRPQIAQDVSREEMWEAVKAAGGLEKAAEAAQITVQKLDRYIARESIPVRVLRLIRDAAK